MTTARVGRTGSLVGSVVSGDLLNIDWSLGTVFAVAATPARVAALAVFAKGRTGAPGSGSLSALPRPQQA